MSDDLNSGTETALAGIETGEQAPEGSAAATPEPSTPPASATEPAGDANNAGGNAGNANTGEKTFTEREMQDIVNHRVAAERAKFERSQAEATGADAQTQKEHSATPAESDKQQSQDDNITVSKEGLESMVREETARNEAERVFMGQVDSLNTEMCKARQDDSAFDALCAELPDDVSQKFFLVFAGQEHAAGMIKTILHDKALSQAFVQCKDPMQMSHILGRAHSAMNQGSNDANEGQPARALETKGAKQSADSMQSDASISAIENELFD